MNLCLYVGNSDVWFNTWECKIMLQPPSAPSPGSANKVHDKERGPLEQAGLRRHDWTVQVAPWEGLTTVVLLHVSAMLLGHCACTMLALWLAPQLLSSYRGHLVPQS